MCMEPRTEAAGSLEGAMSDLQVLSRATEAEIESIGRLFEDLASQVDTILKLAGDTIACIESGNVNAVLSKVQNLGAVARRFIGDRLQAANGILDTVTKERTLLRQLSQVTRGQAAIALETKALSVLTNIEVARLGAVGSGFQYLAHELAEFSKSVRIDTQELAGHAHGRQAAIEETRRVLAAEVPRLHTEMDRVESDLTGALSIMDSNLAQLYAMPAQFRACVSEVAQQIAGVVAAVLAHDITRQQIEHVQEGLALISARLSTENVGEAASAPWLPQTHRGLTIQIYQLRKIREIISQWAGQIRACTEGIRQISATEVVGIGPQVLLQERELSSQFARIDQLERDSQTYSERIQRTFGGHADLAQFVAEHLQRSNSVRDHLQLLTFNSIIEASGLGAQAAAILAIAQCIKGISTEWGQITDQSGATMQEVLRLEKHANQALDAFSESRNEELREAQRQTISGLDDLRAAAAFAGDRAEEMQAATGKMQAKTSQVAASVDLLDGCYARIGGVLAELDNVKRQLEVDHPEAQAPCDVAEVEKLFSANYTTEMEREVLRAALRGADLPVAQPAFSGNGVELF